MATKFTAQDGSVLTIPAPRLSFSQVDMYLRCPRQYEIRYILGHKEAPGFVMTEGSSSHAALETNNKHKIKTGADLPAHTVVEKFCDDLGKRVKDEHPLRDDGKPVTGDDIDDAVSRGRKYLVYYMEQIAPEILPVTAEREIEAEILGVPFIAYTDLETQGRIWDYKTTGASSQKLRAQYIDDALQFSLYALLTGHANVGMIGLIRDTPPKSGENAGKWVRVFRSVRTDGQKAHAAAVVLSVAKAISAGVFPQCSPEGWACSARFCGYYKCWERAFTMQPRRSAGTSPRTSPPRRKVPRKVTP